jgi:hypothetical protein
MFGSEMTVKMQSSDVKIHQMLRSDKRVRGFAKAVGYWTTLYAGNLMPQTQRCLTRKPRAYVLLATIRLRDVKVRQGKV